MNPESKHIEEKLLDYAYGELGSDEAKTVEAHLESCPRCADALIAMKRVRQTMSRLPITPAPAKGLDSLIAYAEQTAHRAQLRQKRRPAWVRWLVPITGVAALSVVLVISGKVVGTRDLPVATRDSPAGIQSEAPSVVAKRPANDETDSQKEMRSEKKRETTGNEWSESSERPAKESRRRDSKVKPQMVNGPRRAHLAKKLGDVPPAGDGDIAEAEHGSPGRGHGAAAGVAANPAAPAPDAKKSRVASESYRDKVMGGVVGGVVGGQINSSSPPRADDREQEAGRLRQALADGAVGQERARLLLRLCNALDDLKRESEADSVCNALIHEFPNSDEAEAALYRQKARATNAEPVQR
jgi:hypothetical protein